MSSPNGSSNPIPGGLEHRRSLSSGMVALDVEDILQVIPQRPPLLMVDQVISLVPGQHAVGVKAVTGNEAGLARHRTGFVFPSTFALEALVQLANIALVYDPAIHSTVEETPAQPDGQAYQLESVSSLEVDQEMATGDRLFLTVSIRSEEAGRHVVEGHAELAGDNFVKTVFSLTRVDGTP